MEIEDNIILSFALTLILYYLLKKILPDLFKVEKFSL